MNGNRLPIDNTRNAFACVPPSCRLCSSLRFRLTLFAVITSGIFHSSDGWSEEPPVPIAEPPSAKLPDESRDPAAWEEPSLFTPQPNEAPAWPHGRRPGRPEPIESLNEPDPLTSPSEVFSENTAETFHADFANRSLTGSPAVGLEALRDREALLALSQRNGPDQPYNIKIGPIPLRMSAGFDIDFSDNSQRSNLNKSSELTLLPRLDISGSLRLSSFASLSLAFGIGYIKYLNHTESDRLLPLAAASLNPESGISFNIKIGKFLINLFDQPQVPQFQADAVTQRSQSQYKQFTNQAGVSILWDTNSRTSMTLRYAHSNSFSFGSNANTTDSSSDSFLASLSCKLSDSLGVGLEAGTATTKYKESFLNSNTTYHAGPFMSLRLSEFLRLQASAGYQGGDYEMTGRVGDNSSLGTYYANVSISNNLNPYFNHQLSFGRESQNGAFSNFTEVNYVRYQANWDVIRLASLGFFASFEDVDESGGLFAQHLRNYSVGLRSAFQLTKHIYISLAYEFTKREATGGQSLPNGIDLDFDENRFSIRLGYTF